MKLSKKTIREINLISVFDKILRERFESSNGFFLDNAPDMWEDEEKEAFDMVTEVEYQLKSAILNILGAHLYHQIRRSTRLSVSLSNVSEVCPSCPHCKPEGHFAPVDSAGYCPGCGCREEGHDWDKCYDSVSKVESPARQSLPTAADLLGSDPDFTGNESTDEYMRRIRGREVESPAQAQEWKACELCVEGKLAIGCSVSKPLIQVDCYACQGTGRVNG